MSEFFPTIKLLLLFVTLLIISSIFAAASVLLHVVICMYYLFIGIYLSIYFSVFYGMLLIGMVQLLLETLMRVLLSPQLTTLCHHHAAVHEILLQEIDPASDNVDPEQMCVCARSCINFKFVKSFSFCPNNDNNKVQVINNGNMNKLKLLLIQISLATECSPWGSTMASVLPVCDSSCPISSVRVGRTRHVNALATRVWRTRHVNALATRVWRTR